MKIVITGASGFVGKQLIPKLLDAGATVLAVGRQGGDIESRYPGLRWCSYVAMSEAARGYDVLLHLAVLNNDVEAPLAEFERVNIGFTLRVVELAKSAGIRKIINVSSVHALYPGNFSNYAVTKREVAKQLHLKYADDVCTFFLPAVVGDRLAGKLALLNRLPPLIRGATMCVLGALRPTVRIETLAAAILNTTPVRQALPRSQILSESQRDNAVFILSKRAIDLLFVVVVAGLFWWGMILIYFMIRIHSAGPGIFAQRRIGRGGHEFVCYKFRTMYAGTPEVGTHAVRHTAITPIGRFLRKTKLDELPQIWNLLRNEMSLVGPRPCLPSQIELIEERRSRGVLEIKPGISGYSQIRGVDMSNPVRLAESDAYYVRLQSLLLDAKVILATALGRGGGDRVQQDSTASSDGSSER